MDELIALQQQIKARKTNRLKGVQESIREKLRETMQEESTLALKHHFHSECLHTEIPGLTIPSAAMSRSGAHGYRSMPGIYGKPKAVHP